MNLVRWTPFNEMSLLRDHLNQFFDTSGGLGLTEGVRNWFPAADIHETDNELVVTADLPGVDPKDVDIRVENNVLTIRGERHFERDMEKENVHRVERMFGGFTRTFALATPVQTDQIKASYKDGVLRVTLPKAEQARSKRIEIKAA
ncbi:MAG TPA: Hsp20/alpha crystallin family protein [Terriglobia bacterium]|nr:Hsp20/alpha crystallin family protein [Terriglobia bacterium]